MVIFHSPVILPEGISPRAAIPKVVDPTGPTAFFLCDVPSTCLHGLARDHTTVLHGDKGWRSFRAPAIFFFMAGIPFADQGFNFHHLLGGSSHLVSGL